MGVVDAICTSLQSFGVNARMADRGRPEEKTGKGFSLGIIAIADGPIPWVNVREVTMARPDGEVTTSYTDYGVKVAYRPPNATITSVRRKTFPFLGRVIDAEWRAGGSERGSALVADVLRRLREDARVREAIMATRDVKITEHPSFWIISTETDKAPTRQAWDCYQAIAQHLIAAEGAGGTIQWDRIEV